MERIGIRELRQNASAYIERVEAGETIEVTNRGRVVARLVPPVLSGIERLEREGKITKAKGNFLDMPPPLPLRPGETPPSEILAQLRKDER
jgi:prevent-host-death family protein